MCDFLVRLIFLFFLNGFAFFSTSWPHPKASSQVICATWRKTARGLAVPPVSRLQFPQTLVESEVSLAQSVHVCSGRACISLDSRPDIVSSAKFVLIVEKDATFQRLLDDGFCSKLSPCIMITVCFPVFASSIDPKDLPGMLLLPVSNQGKGVPDVNSRLMVRKLWDTLHIPIFALVDADPHGRHHLSRPLSRVPRIFSACLPAPDAHISHRASRCSHLFGTHRGSSPRCSSRRRALIYSVKLLTAGAFFFFSVCVAGHICRGPLPSNLRHTFVGIIALVCQ